SFVTHFNYTDRASATAAYQELLESNIIRLRRREALKRSFSHFLLHQAKEFWEKRALETTFAVSAIRAGQRVNEAAQVEFAVASANVLTIRLHVLEAAEQELD
ncbi:hypothetical protein EC968_009553, partial [Mortierella alpina]